MVFILSLSFDFSLKETVSFTLTLYEGIHSKFNLQNLSDKIKVIYENRNSKDIFIKADKNINYGFVISVMSELKRAGLNRIGLISIPK